jgi:hypothetical protein
MKRNDSAARRERMDGALATFRQCVETGKPPLFALRTYDLQLVLAHIDGLEERLRVQAESRDE